MMMTRLLAGAALSVAVFLTLASAALARAGGGQGYGGGGFGGGGFDGGGGLFSLWPLLFLGHGSGSAILVFIVLYYLVRQMQARGGAPYLTSGSSTASYIPTAGSPSIAPKLADADAIAQGIETIQKRDPNFTEAVFLDRAQTAFFKVQQAWAARNQDLARDVMSDALYERHKMQTDQLIANHQIDVLENVVIGHARIADVQPGGTYDAITVAFSASMTDYTIDERTKQMVSGQRYPTSFTEYWSFIRRADAKTAAGAAALASTCPSCGAPLHLTNGRCDYCGAPLRSASADWVVDTIEQAS
jgi:predicted lipid-binding transport protein (Tim44 family)